MSINKTTLSKTELFSRLAKAVEDITPIDTETALAVLNCPNEQFPMVMAYANEMKLAGLGVEAKLCSIMNTKSGSCSEDCAFCAQSGHHNTHVETYDMKASDEIIEAYDTANEQPISRFGIVTSGEGLSPEDIDIYVNAINKGAKKSADWCGSVGIIGVDQLQKLKDAGVTRLHHNLEVAESFFPEICSTHDYSERIEMVKRIKDMGFSICCGGIMGVGEELHHRVELAQKMFELEIDSIPVNFHIPVQGTRIAHLKPIPPMEILKTIAMFRLCNPTAEVKIAAGRTHMRDLQSMVFMAGASSMMIGDLLTVAARSVKEDMQMLKDLEQPYTTKN